MYLVLLHVCMCYCFLGHVSVVRDMINLNETDHKTRQLNTYLRIKTFIVKTLYKCPDSVLRRAVPRPYAQHQECNTICKSTVETYHISVQFKKVVHYSCWKWWAAKKTFSDLAHMLKVLTNGINVARAIGHWRSHQNDKGWTGTNN